MQVPPSGLTDLRMPLVTMLFDVAVYAPVVWDPVPEGRKSKADPMGKRNPGIPGPSACHKPFGS